MAQRLAAVKQALSAAPLTPPGSQFAYSNVSFVILGAVLEEKTGKPWETLIQENIFDPLKMSSAGFGAPGEPGKIDQPWGHGKGLLGIMPSQIDNPPVMGPAGRVHCTIGDWAKFIAQFSGPADDEPHLLDDATMRPLITPSTGGTYAGGWIVLQRPWAGGTALTHDGSNTFWHCSVWIAPARHFAMLVATNSGSDDATAACQEMIGALLKFHDSHQ